MCYSPYQPTTETEDASEHLDLPAPLIPTVESEDEKEATPMPTAVAKEEKASELATQSLLNEAIEAMLSIKKKKEGEEEVPQQKQQVCCWEGERG